MKIIILLKNFVHQKKKFKRQFKSAKNRDSSSILNFFASNLSLSTKKIQRRKTPIPKEWIILKRQTNRNVNVSFTKIRI